MTQACGYSDDSKYIVLPCCTAAQTKSVPNVALRLPHKMAIECFGPQEGAWGIGKGGRRQQARQGGVEEGGTNEGGGGICTDHMCPACAE